MDWNNSNDHALGNAIEVSIANLDLSMLYRAMEY